MKILAAHCVRGERKAALPLLSIVETLRGGEAAWFGASGLVGTCFTMNGTFYPEAFARKRSS